MLLFAGAMMPPNWMLLSLHPQLRSMALLSLAMLAACSVVVVVAFWGDAALRRGHDAPELDAAFVAPAVALDGAAQSGHAGGLQRRSSGGVLGRCCSSPGP